MLAECVLTSHPQGGPVVSWGSRRRKSSAVFADLFSHWCRWVHITFMCLVLNCDVLGGPSSSPQSCLPAVAWWVSSHNSPSNFKKSQQISAIHESTFFSMNFNPWWIHLRWISAIYFFQFKQSQQRQLQQKLHPAFSICFPQGLQVFFAAGRQVGGAQLPSGSPGGPRLLPGDAHGRQGGNDGTKNDGRRNRYKWIIIYIYTYIYVYIYIYIYIYVYV